MVGALAIVIVLAPLAAIALIMLRRRARWAEALNLVASAIVFAAAVALTVSVGDTPHIHWRSYIILDGLGTWSVLCAAIVYLLASIYAVGYMRLLDEPARLPRFYALFAGFALTTLVGPMMNSAGVYWIAIELTTLVSTFLVAFEHAPESIEAAWKYIIVVSAGISLALLGTVLFYWAGSLVLGPSYDMTWAALRQAAPRANHALLVLAFLLVLIGYGTKVGLAPMHTWLPDAHSEGPAPVSALLSGALRNTAMVGIVRYLTVVDAAGVGPLPRTVLVVLGALSLLVAALFIVRQRGVKRLMAYSSVEHMGVIALGFGFGGPLGVAGALYHMLNHSLNKSLMFFGSGDAMHALHSKRIGRIHHVLAAMPVAGVLWIAGAVAITGAPPFGLFLSEFTILRAGLASPNAWAVFVLLVLLVVIFIGFLNHFRAMYFGEHPEAAAPTTGWRPSRQERIWCVLPMWLALVPLLLMGVWWPGAFTHYFAVITAQLGGSGR